MRACIGVVLVSTAIAFNAHAQQLFVTDYFEITMRSGPGLDQKIVRMLPSGTKLTLIQDEVGDGYAQVKTEGGETGYVLNRFLSNEPTARDDLELLRRQMQELQGDPDSLRAKLSSAQIEKRDLIAENEDMSRRVQEMAGELARVERASRDAVKNAEASTRLQQEVEQLDIQVDELRIQNQALRDQSEKKWFMVGALTLLVGIVVGLIIPNLRRKREDGWSRY